MSTGNLSLIKQDQSSFDASVKRLRKKIKDGDLKVKEFVPKERGVVRLSHIPHGFYESEMRNFFSQFGLVTRVRLARSKKTGNSKGFGFVEFKIPEVAEVVAETMNNYLMFDSIMKAVYIPPNEQKFDYLRGLTKDKVPAERNRKAAIAAFNRKLARPEKEKFYSKVAQNLQKQLDKIKALGIEYDFKPIVKHKLKKDDGVLALDESDNEITFKVPLNVQVVKKDPAKSAVLKKESPSSKKQSFTKEILKKLGNAPFKKEVITENNKTESPLQNIGGLQKEITRSLKSQVIDAGHAKKRSSPLEKSNLRGVRKLKGLTVMDKTAKNKMMNIVKMKLSASKSPKSLISSWQIKEC